MSQYIIYDLVKKNRISSVLWGVVALFILLMVCQSFTTNRGPQMEDLIKVSELAVPEDTTLVTRKEGVDQGSQDECHAIYVERLYGTRQSFEKIRLFYDQMLTTDGNWQKDSAFSDATYIAFERADGFILGVYDNETASSISRRQIEDAQQKYPTVYLVEAVYASPTTKELCSQVRN